jgi:hypothetical protein
MDNMDDTAHRCRARRRSKILQASEAAAKITDFRQNGVRIKQRVQT